MGCSSRILEEKCARLDKENKKMVKWVNFYCEQLEIFEKNLIRLKSNHSEQLSSLQRQISEMSMKLKEKESFIERLQSDSTQLKAKFHRNKSIKNEKKNSSFTRDTIEKKISVEVDHSKMKKFPTEITGYLIEMYKKNNYPNVEEIKQISGKTNLKSYQIITWFANRRSKLKQNNRIYKIQNRDRTQNKN